MRDFQFSFADVLNWTQGRHLLGSKTISFTGVSTDSRTLKAGELFIALKGPNFNGNDFLKEAVQKGASGILASSSPSPDLLDELRRQGVALAGVEDGLKSVQKLAENYRKLFSIPIVGITGSCGKTTTKDIVHVFLETLGPCLKNEGTLNNHLGVPLTLLRLRPEHKTCVLEMGTSSSGEIQRLASLASPTLGAILNIGSAHLKMLRDMEGVLHEKWTLLESNGSTLGIYNEDDPLLKNEAKQSVRKLWSFGIYEGGMLRASNIESFKNQSTRFSLIFQGEEVGVVKVPFLGLHHVYNVLAAMLVGHALGVSWDEMVQKAQALKLPKMRWEVVKLNGLCVINDAYNANPKSVRCALEAFQLLKTEGKKIFVFGDMLDLGEEGPDLHRSLASDLLKSDVDILVTLGPLSASLLEAVREKGFLKGAGFSFETHEEVIHCLESIAGSSDALLFKGSRGMGMERIAEAFLAQFKRDHPQLVLSTADSKS